MYLIVMRTIKNIKDYIVISGGRKKLLVCITPHIIRVYELHGKQVGKQVLVTTYREVLRNSKDIITTIPDAIEDARPTNFILIEVTATQYIFVGQEIISFSSDEQIIRVVVTSKYYKEKPYAKEFPFAYNKKLLYSMNNHKTVPIELFDLHKNIVNQYNGIIGNHKKAIKHAKKSFRVKKIY